jgi:hypothetical protein
MFARMPIALAGELLAVLQTDAADASVVGAEHFGDLLVEAEVDPAGAQARPHEVGGGSVEDVLHERVAADDVGDLDAAVPEALDPFDAEGAGADDHRALDHLAGQPVEYPAGVLHGPHGHDAGQVGARPRREVRVGAGGDQQLVVGQLAPAREQQRVGARVDLGDAGLEPLDAELRVEVGRDGEELLLAELADQEVGERGAVVGGLRVVGQDDDAAVGIGPSNVERSRGPGRAVTDDRVPGGQRALQPPPAPTGLRTRIVSPRQAIRSKVRFARVARHGAPGPGPVSVFEPPWRPGYACSMAIHPWSGARSTFFGPEDGKNTVFVASL